MAVAQLLKPDALAGRAVAASGAIAAAARAVACPASAAGDYCSGCRFCLR